VIVLARAGRRPRLAARALLLSALLASPVLAPGAADRPARVRVIATGGTIANAPTGRLSGDQLVSGLPHPERLGRLEGETFANVPSTALTLDDCVRLSRHIVDLLAAEHDLDGIVVTSGTDTLEELAWFLYLTVADRRPIVVVGAMRPPGAHDADGAANLAEAVRVAASASARGRGTLVVMHGQILSARTVEKRHATDIGAFDAPEVERLGVVKRGRVRFARAGPGTPPPGAFALPPDGSLPRVDVLLVYQGATGDLVDAATAHGARGIVLAAAGAGALTPSQSDAARRAARAGVPVVVASRTGAGRVPAQSSSSELISAGDLAPVKARVLLALALTRGLDASEIAELFASHGER
jgi:L-asparaginase